MKQKRAFVKRMLTFVLCMAMVFTSVNVPVMTVMAAENVTDSEIETVVETDTEVVETSVEETTAEVTSEEVSETVEETVIEETTEEAMETVVEETTTEVAATEEAITEVVTIEETTIEEVVVETVGAVELYDFGEGNPKPELPEGYTESFVDDFDGSELNMNNWNREQRQPGWTNNELQEYTDSEDNSFVADGKLVLQALKTKDANGNDYYTSGKVTTKNKEDFTYGKVEASIRVPSGGQGMWPAFWMMPTNEQFYGTWPKCGEIDIMEVLGHEPEKAYQTLHWGDPHGEKQGTMVLEDGETFADDYHVYAVEWLPGEIIYTIDGIETHRVTDWYTKVEGGDEATFPAPFDQDFFLQLNLAVGGSWPGNPDETTVFGEGSQMVIDWVRVSQKSDEAYQAMLDELEQPDRTANLRDPDENGNYVVNGNFAVAEDLNESDAISAGADWVFLTAQGGKGNATIDPEAGELKIDTTNESDSEHGQTYSLQLVQPGIPMEQGIEYTLTFDAKADEARKMIVDISNTSSWSRYLEDTTVELGTDWDTYTCTFGVKAISDENARLEFNFGKQGSVADVYLKNVTLKKTGTVEVEEVATTPDGNYVKNGAFEVGEGRLAYWNVPENVKDKVSVTNKKDTANSIYVRELKVVGAEGLTAEDVTVSQSGLALAPNTNYVFTMDAYAEAAASITVKVAGVTETFNLTEEKQTVTFKLETEEEVTNKDIVLALGSETTVYVDNVAVKEDSLLVNGSFDNGMSGWTPFKDSGVGNVSWEVTKDAGNNVMKYTIPDTGNTDWFIQLKQNDVTLENGKRYKLTFRVKSNIERDIQFAFQRNGEKHTMEDGKTQDWTPYSKTEIVTVGSKGDTTWETFSTIFDMTEPTDEGTIFAVTMGAVGGKQVAQLHEIYLDDFVLEETDEEIPTEVTPVTEEMIVNGDFAKGTEGWEGTEIYSPATGSVDFANGKAVYNITSLTGAENWNVQMKQNGVTLVNGETYNVKFEIKSSEARDVKWSLINPSNWDWYIGETLSLKANELYTVDYTYTVEDKASSDNIQFQITMSNDDGITVVPAGEHTIEIDNISVKMAGEGSEPNPNPTPADGEMIKNNDFASDGANWNFSTGETGAATISYEAETGATVDVTNVGTDNWHVQLQQSGLKLEQGKSYVLKLNLRAENSRYVEYCLMAGAPSYAWYGGGKSLLTGNNELDELEVIVDMSAETNSNANFTLSLGQMFEGEGDARHPITSEPGKITIESVSLKEKSEEGGAGSEDPDVKEGLRIEKIADQTYTGKAIKPAVVVYDGETLLVEKKDYTVKYEKNVNVGTTATVKVTGKGNYTGTDTATFNIVKKDLGDADITAADVSAVVKNNKVTAPKVTVKMGKTTLKENRDYVLERPVIQENNDGSIKTGQYEIKIVAKEDTANAVCNFKGSRTIKYDVVSKTDVAMSKVTVKAYKVNYADYINGTMPVVNVTYGSGSKKVNLVDRALCKITYPDEVKVGKNNVITVTARIGSGYYGSKTVKFEVTGTKLSSDAKKFEVTGIKPAQYTGQPITQEQLVIVDKTGAEPYTMQYEEDYTLSYSKNTNQGTATVVITGKGLYTGTIKKTFKIEKVDSAKEGNTINIAEIEAQTYTGKDIKPVLNVTVNGISLVEKKDYTVKYSANKAVGTANTKVTLKGNFKGSASAEFVINKKALNADDITVNASLNATITNKGKLTNPKVTVKMGKTTLKAGRDYNIAWPQEMSEVVDGKTVYKPGHYTVTVVAVADTDTKKCNFTGSSVEIPYDVLAYGTIQMSKVTAKAGKVSYLDYAAGTMPTVTVTYGSGSKKVDLVEKGLVKINYPELKDVVVGKNNVITIESTDAAYYGAKTVKFEVTGTKLSTDKKKFEITGIDAAYPYTGKAIEPEVVIKDLKRVISEEGDTKEYYVLTEDDYSVSYSKNVNAGTAKVTITGKGAYTGKITKTFKIDKETMDWADAVANFLGNLF